MLVTLGSFGLKKKKSKHIIGQNQVKDLEYWYMQKQELVGWRSKEERKKVLFRRAYHAKLRMANNRLLVSDVDEDELEWNMEANTRDQAIKTEWKILEQIKRQFSDEIEDTIYFSLGLYALIAIQLGSICIQQWTSDGDQT